MAQRSISYETVLVYLFIYLFNCLSVCLVSPRRLRGREEKRRRRGGGSGKGGLFYFIVVIIILIQGIRYYCKPYYLFIYSFSRSFVRSFCVSVGDEPEF